MTKVPPPYADRPLLAKAWELSGQRRYEEAIEASTQHIELHPDDADGYFRRACLFGHQRRFEEAVADWDRYLSLKPGSALALCHRGWNLYQLDCFEEALEDYSAAMESAPSNVYMVPLWRARCLAALGRFDEALQDLDRIPDDLGPLTSECYELREWIAHERPDSSDQA